jgi:putative ABC transport system permease protein
MGLTGLRLRSLFYHWRGNLAVLLGVVVGTAVLTGALLVGDSLRGSLRDLTLRRLGWVDQALVGLKFFRVALSESLPADHVSCAILLQATAEGKVRSVRSVTLLGIDPRFGLEEVPEGFWSADSDAVLLNPAVMDDLGVQVGDEVVFRVQRATDVPRESLLGKRSDPVEALRFRVAGRLGDELAARFSLNPSPVAPRNAIVSLFALQRLLDQPGRANALLVGGPRPGFVEDFRGRLTLDDWGLRLTTPRERADALFDRYGGSEQTALAPSQWYQGFRDGRPQAKFATTYARGVFNLGLKDRLPREPLLRSSLEDYFQKHHGYLSLESRQLILAPEVSSAALTAAKDAGLEAAPTLVYLTKLEAGGQVVAGIVAALPLALSPPLGPFLPSGVKAIADDQIVIVRSRLPQKPDLPELQPGAEVTLRFKPPEHQPGLQPDRTALFHVAGTIPLEGAADDPELTPPFPGITDQDDARSWKLPFEDPNDPQWLTDRIRQEYGDPLYWGEYRTTPKAYITLAAGQKLWASRFGNLTSVRLAPRPGETPEDARTHYTAALLRHLDPDAGGLTFQAVKANALAASEGAMNFAQLFLYFSFFLIAAALLLVALLFRLNLDRRASEVGLLLSVGYRRRAVWWLLLGEGTVLALGGVLVGLGAALAYTVLLVRFLAAVWPGGTLKSFLQPHFANSGWSLMIGAIGSLVIGVLSIAWALFGLGRVPPAALLKGQTSSEGQAGAPTGGRWSWIVAAVALFLAPLVMSLAALVPGSEAQAGSFFSSGALLLTAALAALAGWLRSARLRPVEGGGWWAVARLGIRNAARHPGRSLLTAGLLASVAFLLVAIESFRRHAQAETGINAPDGGFALLAESDLPIVDPEGVLRTYAAKSEDNRELLKETRIVAFRVRPGDDASCLNLYQPRRPRILGVPATLIERGGFRFAAAPPGANPWQTLELPGKGVPAFGEQNTVLWQLKKDVGDPIEVPDAQGTAQTLRIDGLLQDSVFQSGLLISEERFKQLYPGVEGYQLFLVQTPSGREKSVTELLEKAFADRGIEVTPTAKRLNAYLEVENTYLTTFQALGGLGLVLGSLGLAVVLLRGVWERRGELALLRALGWRRLTLGWLILAENGFLLLVGLGSGALAALLSVLPHLAATGGTLPWRDLLLLFAMVVLVGLGAGAAAVWSTLRAPLIMALRRE